MCKALGSLREHTNKTEGSPGLNTVTREVTWDREGKLANKNCTPETLEVPN